MGLTRILVPLDGSVLAEAAITKAIELADPATTTLILLRVAESHVPGYAPYAMDSEARVEAERYLAHVEERLKGAPVARVTRSVWFGHAAAGIVEAARLMSVDLIVLSTHGRSGLGRLVLGSVAEAVLRGTHVPVLVVRDATAPLWAAEGESARPTKEVHP